MDGDCSHRKPNIPPLDGATGQALDELARVLGEIAANIQGHQGQRKDLAYESMGRLPVERDVRDQPWRDVQGKAPD